MPVYTRASYKELQDEINEWITDDSQNCTPVEPLDDYPLGKVFYVTLEEKDPPLRAGWGAMRHALEEWAEANDCEPPEWELPNYDEARAKLQEQLANPDLPDGAAARIQARIDKMVNGELTSETLWSQDIHDEILEQLNQLKTDCPCCCERDAEGFGEFLILAGGPMPTEAIDYEREVNEVQLDFVIAGHAFNDPYQTMGGVQVGSIAGIPGPPDGTALSYQWQLFIQAWDSEEERWVGPSVGFFLICGEGSTSTGTAEIPFRVFAVDAPANATAERYTEWRLAILYGGMMDLCDDCSDEPKPFCGDEE